MSYRDNYGSPGAGGYFRDRDGYVATPEQMPPDPTLLLDLDFREPAEQAFPATVGEVTALGLPAPTEIWLCDESSGDLVGEIAGYQMTPVGSPAHDETAVGFWDGADMHNRAAVACNITSQRWRVDDEMILDFDASTSFAILVGFRVREQAGATYQIVGKGTGSASNYRLRLIGPTYYPQFGIDDAATAKYSSASSATGMDDGAWHCCLVVCDRDADTMCVYSDRGNGANTDISAVGSLSNLVHNEGFSLGKSVGGNAMLGQYAYCAVWTGANAEGMGQSDFDAFWTHASQNTSPSLSTYSRASSCSPIIGYESGFGVRVGSFGVDHFAHAWDSGFSHANKLAALFEDAATNLCTYATELNNVAWTPSNVTVTADDAEAPDGQASADELAATSNDGYVKSANMTTVASTKYVGSCFLKRSGGGDVSGRLIMYDESGASEDAAVVFTATDEWQRFEIPPTAASSTSTSLRIEIDTSGEAVHAWGAQLEASDYGATSLIRTTAAAATRVATDARLTNPTGDTYLTSPRGEVAIDAVIPNSAVDVSLFDADSDNDRVALFGDASGAFNVLINDASGAGQQDFDNGGLAADTEYSLRARWNASANLYQKSVSSDSFRDTNRQDGAAGSWTAGANVAELQIGQDKSQAQQRSKIARVRVWDEQREDAP